MNLYTLAAFISGKLGRVLIYIRYRIVVVVSTNLFHFGLPEPSHPDRRHSNPSKTRIFFLWNLVVSKSTCLTMFMFTCKEMIAPSKNCPNKKTKRRLLFPGQCEVVTRFGGPSWNTGPQAPQFMGPPLVQWTPRQTDEVVSLGYKI